MYEECNECWHSMDDHLYDYQECLVDDCDCEMYISDDDYDDEIEEEE